jgi:hypothetical protein
MQLCNSINKTKMKKIYFLFMILFLAMHAHAQNVGIGNPTPTEKLHVDSGSIKIGKAIWNATNIPFLKFGDANYVTIGEEEADDKLTIRARELFIRPSGIYTAVPVSIKGTDYFSHFFIGANEDTYIRGGKNISNVNIADLGGRVGIGISNPTRAMLEQNGVVGNTAAIFGGEGAGISLQRNFPAIGFNHYSDGAHKSIAAGYGAQLGLNQVNGSFYLASFPFTALPNQVFPSFVQRFNISRFGKVGIGTDDPQSDIHIITRNYTELDEGTDMGLTIESNYNFSGFPPLQNVKWNIHNGYGVVGQFGGLYYLNFWINGAPASRIGSDGTYYQVSDLNLKKQIHYLKSENILTKIISLNPASYLMKSDAQNHPLHYGFIAQEVEKLFPEFVVTDRKNSKMISYSSFIPILTKGIQEQQQQIETLLKENADLKVRLERLEKFILSK